MKHLYLIGGPMGVGKTAACQALKALLPHSVFLDGDWCWDMHPFTVTAETCAMVTDNIAHLLGNFLRCSEIDHVIFGWVMHEQAIIDDLLARLSLNSCRVHVISLICSPQALTARIQKDVDAGIRQADVLERSLARLPLYEKLGTVKIDTTSLSIAQAAQQIIAITEQI